MIGMRVTIYYYVINSGQRESSLESKILAKLACCELNRLYRFTLIFCSFLLLEPLGVYIG